MREARAEKERQSATVAEQAAHGAPAKPASRKGAKQKKGEPKAKKTAKAADAKQAAKAPRAGKPKGAVEARSNKKAEVIPMMKRAKGATLVEILEATGWQKHTVRGFVSILGSKGSEKGRIFEECRRGTKLSHREVARRAKFSSNRFRVRPGRRCRVVRLLAVLRFGSLRNPANRWASKSAPSRSLPEFYR